MIRARLRCCGRFCFWKVPLGPWACTVCDRTFEPGPGVPDVPKVHAARYLEAIQAETDRPDPAAHPGSDRLGPADRPPLRAAPVSRRRGPARAAAGDDDAAAEYRRFRTGLTFRDVRAMLWTSSPDPRDWRYKRRGTVLGLWHQIKQEMWREAQRRADEREMRARPRARRTLP